jgi:RNA polymerase sigma factor (sigma-70 family)
MDPGGGEKMCISSQAFVAEMYGLYSEDVCRLLSRLTQRRDDAAELTQDTFVAFLEAVQSVQTIANPHAWLMKTAYRLWCDWCGRRTKATATLKAHDRQSRFQQSPLDGMVAVEDSAEVRAALQHLPPSHLAVLVLTVQEGMSYAQVAKFLGVSVRIVKRWRTLAVARLREHLTLRPPPPTHTQQAAM